MMYSEFIERTGYSESYVTFADYADFIEPAYMRLDVDKANSARNFSTFTEKKCLLRWNL